MLVSANRIPMLRFGKPQPQNLSAYLTQRIKSRTDRTLRKQRLEGEWAVAATEDTWDFVLQRWCGIRTEGVGHEGGRESKWVDEVEVAYDWVVGLMDGEWERNRVWAKEMLGVVDREREMAEQEKKEREEKKWEEKLRRRKDGMQDMQG